MLRVNNAGLRRAALATTPAKRTAPIAVSFIGGRVQAAASACRAAELTAARIGGIANKADAFPDGDGWRVQAPISGGAAMQPPPAITSSRSRSAMVETSTAAAVATPNRSIIGSDNDASRERAGEIGLPLQPFVYRRR